MFAARLTTKELGEEKVWVMVFTKKSLRDRFVKFVNEDVNESQVYWDRNTSCETMSTADARKFIGADEPIFEHDGWSGAYGYIPFNAYEDIVSYLGGRMPTHKYRHRRWNGTSHYDVIEKTTEYRKVG